jgi:hypothetical protein
MLCPFSTQELQLAFFAHCPLQMITYAKLVRFPSHVYSIGRSAPLRVDPRTHDLRVFSSYIRILDK